MRLDALARLLNSFLSVGLVGASALYAEGRAYVANRSDNTVAVVDTSSDLLLSTIPVEHLSLNFVGVAVGSSGRFVYVTNQSFDTVSIIDTLFGRVTAVIPVCDFPWAVAAHPTEDVAYVTCSSWVMAIDPFARAVIRAVNIGGYGVAVHPDGSRLYVGWDNSVVVLDASSLEEIATTPLGSNPDGIAVSPDGGMVYVSMRHADILKFVDAATNVEVDAVAVGETPRAVAVDPGGKRIYVAMESGDLAVVDAASHDVIATVPVSSFSVGVEPDGSRLYVPNDDGVAVIDTQTHQVIHTLDVGAGSFAFGVFVGPVWPNFFADGFESGDLGGWLAP